MESTSKNCATQNKSIQVPIFIFTQALYTAQLHTDLHRQCAQVLHEVCALHQE